MTAFWKGFAVGVAIIAFVTAEPIITEQQSANWANIGWWIDRAVEAAIAGLVFGALVRWSEGSKKSG